MAAKSKPQVVPSKDLASFTEHLQGSTRIMALLGAGLSAASGLPTFRGAGGMWRTYDSVSLASPKAFCIDPGLVWQFYSYRRHMALNAKPNRAHLALAELANRRPGFLTLSQNVDGLSPRAGHPAKQLKLLHGSLYDIKCFDCDYIRKDDFSDPVAPVLAMPEDASEMHESLQAQSRQRIAIGLSDAIEKKAAEIGAAAATDSEGTGKSQAVSTKKHTLIKGADISDINVPIPEISAEQLPHCPECKTGLLRPGVVWFGEALPEDVMKSIDDWIQSTPKIDLMLVIGTSSQVYPAAGYTDIARKKGAKVAVINMDEDDAVGLKSGDWFFQGDAGEIVPEILKSVIGEIEPLEPSGPHYLYRPRPGVKACLNCGKPA
jgi:NAD+-dependent protein deacetylase sirtuin 5